MTEGRRIDMGLSLRGLLVAALISSSSAAANGAESKTVFPPCTTTATEADRKAAQGAFAAGQGSFNEADYSTAITYWRDAYRRDCSAHALLLNLARAYELNGDRGEAVNALETYLQRKPDVPDAEQIRRRIENLKTQMAAAEKAAAPPPPPPPTPAATPATAPVAGTTPPAAPSSAPPADAADTDRSRSIVPLVLAGAGTVAGVVGAVVLAGGNTKVQDAAEKCPDRQNCRDPIVRDLGNEGRDQMFLGGAVLGAGLAAAGGGLLWYFLSAPASDAPHAAASAYGRTVATPAIGPGYAGISFAGAF